MLNEGSRKLWHYNTTKVERKRHFEPITASVALAGLTAAAGTAGVGAGIFGMFNKKKQNRNVADPLAGLRAQLQALAGRISGQVAKQKEINAARTQQMKTEGQQGIAENIRAERGFGNTSLQDRLNTELMTKLTQGQSEADLAAENWGLGQEASILSGTSGMYPTEIELPQEPNWGANLLGAGAQMAISNWQNEQQWKQMAKYFPNMGSNIMTVGA